MTKALRRLLLPLGAVSCLAACDPHFTVPVEVTFSHQFQTDWDKGFPAEVAYRFESKSTSFPTSPKGMRLGYFCEAADAFVKFQGLVDEMGCLPEDMEVTVWIAPAPELAQSRCQVQGVSKTIKIPPGKCPGGVTAHAFF